MFTLISFFIDSVVFFILGCFSLILFLPQTSWDYRCKPCPTCFLKLFKLDEIVPHFWYYKHFLQQEREVGEREGEIIIYYHLFLYIFQCVLKQMFKFTKISCCYLINKCVSNHLTHFKLLLLLIRCFWCNRVL